MTYEIAERARRRTRRVQILGGVTVVTLLAGFGLLSLGGEGGAAAPSPTSPATGRAVGGTNAGGASLGGSAPQASTGAAVAPSAPASPGAVVVEPLPDVTLETDPATGIVLPVSSVAGPRQVNGGVASGFEHSPRGAAFAAMHISTRLQAAVGSRIYLRAMLEQLAATDDSGPLRENIVTEYAAGLERTGVEPGEPLRKGGSVDYLGYQVERYTPKAATIRLLQRTIAPGGGRQYSELLVHTRWVNEDWAVVAPREGLWSNAMTPVASPAGYTSFTAQLSQGGQPR